MLRCHECGEYLELDVDGYPLPCPCEEREMTEEQEAREAAQAAFDFAVDVARERGAR